jgi:hypothetical protein
MTPALRAAPVLLLPFLLGGGCLETPAQPRQQNAELRQISREQRAVTLRVVGDLPVRFGAIRVSVVGPNNSTLGARASWEPADGPESLREHLRARVAAARPDLDGGRPVKLVLRCDYFDADGTPTGSETLTEELTESGRGRVTFRNLGVNGPVHRVDVTPEAVVWESQGREETVPLAKGE